MRRNRFRVFGNGDRETDAGNREDSGGGGQYATDLLRELRSARAERRLAGGATGCVSVARRDHGPVGEG